MLALDDSEEIAPLASRLGPPRCDAGASTRENRAGERSTLAFAGLALELTGDAEACARVERAARAGMSARAEGAPAAIGGDLGNTVAPKFAASCRLHLVGPPAIEREVPANGLAWDWGAEAGELVTRFGGARIGRAPGNRERDAFEGIAWLAGDARAPHHLLGGLAVLLSHRLGGGVFHAASVELDGAVVAFVGPSGAGKTTACRHMDGAPLVSVDRLAILPLGSRLHPIGPLGSRLPPMRWFSHPLPGGTAPFPDMPGASPRWRPLAGVLRVEQSTQGTAIAPRSPALGVKLLRESTFQAGLRPSAEHELLEALEDLVQHVPVARLELQLGTSLPPMLRRWLVGETRSPRRVSPNVEASPNAQCPSGHRAGGASSQQSTCPSPAQRGHGEPGTNLGHEVLEIQEPRR